MTDKFIINNSTLDVVISNYEMQIKDIECHSIRDYNSYITLLNYIASLSPKTLIDFSNQTPGVDTPYILNGVGYYNGIRLKLFDYTQNLNPYLVSYSLLIRSKNQMFPVQFVEVKPQDLEHFIINLGYSGNVETVLIERRIWK